MSPVTTGTDFIWANGNHGTSTWDITVPCIFSMVQEDDFSGEEEEEEEEIYFSAQDLCQIRNAIFNLLKNFLRLLPKFSLKEKPQCIQTCIEVSENPQDLWLTAKNIVIACISWVEETHTFLLVLVFQVFVALTNFEPIPHKFLLSQARWVLNLETWQCRVFFRVEVLFYSN